MIVLGEENAFVSLYDENGYHRSMEDIEIDILRNLFDTERSMRAVAVALGVSRASIYRKLRLLKDADHLYERKEYVSS